MIRDKISLFEIMSLSFYLQTSDYNPPHLIPTFRCRLLGLRESHQDSIYHDFISE